MTARELSPRDIIPPPEKKASIIIADLIVFSADLYLKQRRLAARVRDIRDVLEVNNATWAIPRGMMRGLEADVVGVGDISNQFAASAMARVIERMGGYCFRIAPTGEEDSYHLEGNTNSAPDPFEYLSANHFGGFRDEDAVFSDQDSGLTLVVAADQFSIEVADDPLY